MIKPHGTKTLKPRLANAARKTELLKEAETLPSILLSSAAAANLVMLGGGYFTPLDGFMTLDDALCVADNLHTTDGLFWPVPILNIANDVSAIRHASRIALCDPNMEGHPVIAVMDVTSIDEMSENEKRRIIENVYGTTDTRHPGVASFEDQGRYVIAGPVEVLHLSYFANDFAGTFMTAVEIREEFIAREWQTIVAFQTRNPMHLAHEQLCRIAMERVNADGLVIHMLLGKLKEGDIPANVRDACIRRMVDLYFRENSVLVSGYGFDMLYAGPREALLHAVFRQNMGATHLIVGRDHAGVGDYYGPFDAQDIFEQVPSDALEIDIFAADHTAWSKKLNKVVMMREAPDHSPEDYVLLSGTKVRELLGNGILPPPEFARPEVAEILMEHYQSSSRT